MENATVTDKTKKTVGTRKKKSAQPLAKPRYRYLKKYVELVPDPWELGIES